MIQWFNRNILGVFKTPEERKFYTEAQYIQRQIKAMQEIKKLDKDGKAFLALNEGLRLKPYLCSANVPTIGIGCTYYENGRRVKMSDPAISVERAYKLFDIVVDHYEKEVWSVTRDDLTQSQFNALVSFAFNVGTSAFKKSTLLKRINRREESQRIYSAFMMWIIPAEIRNRRKREAELFVGNVIG